MTPVHRFAEFPASRHAYFAGNGQQRYPISRWQEDRFGCYFDVYLSILLEGIADEWISAIRILRKALRAS